MLVLEFMEVSLLLVPPCFAARNLACFLLVPASACVQAQTRSYV